MKARDSSLKNASVYYRKRETLLYQSSCINQAQYSCISCLRLYNKNQQVNGN